MNKFSLLILCSLFFSCKKNDDNLNVTPADGVPIPVSTPVTGSVAGKLIDENNNPVANAQLQVGINIVTTDNAGFFNSGNITLDKYITSVKVAVPGYYTAYRTFSAHETKNYIFIKLIRKQAVGSFSSTSDGLATLSNGTTIQFQPNSFRDKRTGSAYTGTVKVFSKYIDPTSAEIAATIPGGLLGEDDSRLFVLRSAGMLVIELESDAGIALQLVSNKPASIKLPIPASLQANAPAIIEIWSLNDRGIWIKEGTATRNGTMYEFTATHFSFWNCGFSSDCVYMDLHIQNESSEVLANTGITLSVTGYWGSAFALSDSLGNASGFVPSNEILQLTLHDLTSQCTFYSQQTGPYNTNANETIRAIIPPAQQYTVSGHASSCSGQPVSQGTAVIRYGNYGINYVSIVNGYYSQSIAICQAIDHISITVFDNQNGQYSNAVTVSITGNLINAGTISACGNTIYEFINYTIDNINNFSITSASPSAIFYASANSGYTTISASDQSIVRSLTFLSAGNGSGSHIILNDSLIINYASALPDPLAYVTYDTYGSAGENITGSFIFNFSNDGGVTYHNLTGSFRVIRRL